MLISPDSNIASATTPQAQAGTAGNDTIGTYDSGIFKWFVRNYNTSGNANNQFIFDPNNASPPSLGADTQPVGGNWLGGNTGDKQGVYDPNAGKFHLAKGLGVPGITNFIIVDFAPVAGTGLKAIAGDWNGDGQDSTGLYDPATGTFYLRNVNQQGANVEQPITFTFGAAPSAYVPVAGDWDNDGVDTVGLYDASAGAFFLKNVSQR